MQVLQVSVAAEAPCCDKASLAGADSHVKTAKFV